MEALVDPRNLLTALIAAERENPQAFGRTPPARTS